MPYFEVDPDKCKRDAICVAECPARVIEMKTPQDPPTASEDFADYCIRCGHCVAVCPAGAFSLEGMPPSDCPEIKKDLMITSAQAEQFLRSRRSIRSFKKKRVEKEKLETLMRVACYAPSAKNMQPWHWIVVENPDRVKELAGMVVDWMRDVIRQSPDPAAVATLARVTAAWDQGEERVCRGAPHVIVLHGQRDWGYGSEDGALALAYLELYAPMLGLGSCWGGYFYTAVNGYPPLARALGIPEEHRAYGAVMVGYPRFSYRRQPTREAPRIVWL
ncbi:MAG: nitroreductase family protein [Deltaproteobacteria bacterium]|nr:nitroreductase family protein [Deltaproteobacteria bacterium]MBW2102547.1 nitroreductase family protein [Deltaproteobacteria bacterium]